MGCNPPFAEFVGRPREEIVGMTDYDLFDKEVADAFREHDEGVLERGEKRHNEEWITYPDGRRILIDTLKTPYRGHDGTLIGVIGVSRDITDRHRSQEALREVTNRLSLAVRAGGVGIWDYDIVNDKLVWDDQMYRLYGITPDQFSGAYEAWKAGVHPEDRERGDREIQQAVLGEKEFDTEFRVLWPDGTVRDIRALAIVQRDSSGRPLHMIGTNWDITEAKLSQIALRDAEERWRLAIEGTGLTVWEWDVASNIVPYPNSLLKILGYELDEIRDYLNFWIMSIHPDDVSRFKFAMEEVASGQKSRNSVEYRIRLKDGTYKWLLTQGHVVELTQDGRPKRMLGTHTDLTERREAEEAMRVAEERWRFALEGSGDGVWDWDGETNTSRYSDRYRAILGYPPSDAPENNDWWQSLIHPDDLPAVQKAMEDYMGGMAKTYVVEFRMLCQNGAYKWVLSRGIAVKRDPDSGNPLRMIGTMSDQTEQRRAQETLREAEERWRFALEGSGDGVWEWDFENKTGLHSDRLRAILGYAPDEGPESMQWFRILSHPDDLGIVTKALDDYAAGRKPHYSVESRLRCKDGSYKWVLSRGIAVKQAPDGTLLRMVGTMSDQTEQRRAQEALRVAEERWRLALEGTGQSVFDLDLIANRTQAGDPLKPMLGYAVDEFDDNMDEWMKLIHPDDLPGVKSAIADIVSGVRTAPVEYRIRCKDGSYKWLLTQGKIVGRRGDTIPTRMVGTHTDLTERRRAEEALREAEQRWRFALEGSGNAVWDFDWENGVAVHSEQFLTTFGYAPEDNLGSPDCWASMVHPDDMPLVDKAMDDYRTGLVPHYAAEFRMRCKDGSYKWVLSRGMALKRGPDGSILRLIGTVLDQTEQRLTREALREAEERSRLALEGTGQSVWDWNAETSETRYSDPLKPMLGYDLDEFPDDLEEWVKRMHPDDIPRARAAMVDYIGGLIPEYSVEYRLQCKDGSYKWILTRGKFVTRGSDGHPVRMVGTHADQTERHRAEDALRAAEQRWRFALEGSGDGVWDWVVSTGEVHFSDQWKRMLGFEPDELPDRLSEWSDRVHPDDMPEVQKALDVHFRGETEHYQAEHRVLCKDGSFKWILDRGMVVSRSPDGKPLRMIGTHTDLTQRIEAEKALRSQADAVAAANEMLSVIGRVQGNFLVRENAAECFEQMLETLLAYTQSEYGFMGEVRHDEAGQPFVLIRSITNIAWSEETRRLYAEQAGKGMEFHNLNNLIGQVLATGNAVIANDAATDPRRGGLPHGHPIVGCFLGIPVRHGDRLVGIVGVANRPGGYSEDLPAILHPFITTFGSVIEALGNDERRRQAEENLRRSRNELQAANAALERASRLKDEFLANMSHELRTPLTGIMANAESLLDVRVGPLNEEQRDSATSIFDCGEHLTALITDVLDLAKVGSGNLALNLATCDATDICEASLRMVRQPALKRRLDSALSVPDEKVEFIADPRRFKQILVNLLSNSVKFTPDGGKFGIDVRADRATHLLHFEVWDTGIGIPESQFEMLFEPFVQLDGSLTRHHEGTGLGLALVQSMAKLHGGSVRVDSVVGEGSRFTVTIPWTEPEDAEAAHGPEAKKPELPQATSGLLIVLVDDNDEIAKVVGAQLRRRGHRVERAASGAEALARIPELKPDIVLMDVQMPEMDGLEVTRRLRAHSDCEVAGVPIIALTGLAMEGDRERCLEAGADDYITKPVSIKTLDACLARLLGTTGPEETPTK